MSKLRLSLKWAQTLDGQLCDDSNTSKWISGSLERLETHRIRKNFDGVMVGANTFIEDLAKLTVREIPLNDGEAQPARVIIDPRGRVLEKARADRALMAELCSNELRPTYLLTGEDIEEGGRQALKNSGVYVKNVELDFESANFGQNLEAALLSFGLEKILVEGGPRLLGQLIKLGIYDELVLSISSKITGGQHHRINTQRLLDNAIEHEIKSSQVLGSDVMVFMSPVVKKREGVFL